MYGSYETFLIRGRASYSSKQAKLLNNISTNWWLSTESKVIFVWFNMARDTQSHLSDPWPRMSRQQDQLGRGSRRRGINLGGIPNSQRPREKTEQALQWQGEEGGVGGRDGVDPAVRLERGRPEEAGVQGGRWPGRVLLRWIIIVIDWPNTTERFGKTCKGPFCNFGLDPVPPAYGFRKVAFCFCLSLQPYVVVRPLSSFTLHFYYIFVEFLLSPDSEKS